MVFKASSPLSELEQLRILNAQLQSELLLKRQEIVVRDTKLQDQSQLLVARDHELFSKNILIEKLKAHLAALKRARFGRSSEKLDHTIEQLELALGDLEETEAESQARYAKNHDLPEKAPRKNTPHGRKPLPEHLPREEVVHEPECLCPQCGGTRFSLLGTDERDVLEYVPSHFKRVAHKRPKYSCRDCETIIQAPMPTLPIERGRPGAGLLAHVLVSKYCDHLPLYRQSEIYAREGVELERSTLSNWVGTMAALVDPLIEAIGSHVRQGQVLHADDTTVPVLEPGRGKTKTGRLWTLVRDEHNWGSEAPPAVFYHYSPDRKAEHAKTLLGNAQGFLHADAYSGFKSLYEKDMTTGKAPLTEVACWAHARRYLFEEYDRNKSPAAHEALQLIAKLFALEDEIKGKTPDIRLEARQKHAIPILETLKAHLAQTLNRISQKSTLAKAIRYALGHWQALTQYTKDGRLEMSNNAAERAMRPIALGRKNYLFAGSDAGGKRAAAFYTLIETAKINNINPEKYLADIISRIPDHHINKITQLLPWNWKCENDNG